MAIIEQELGRRLREAREACAMTQEQVAGKKGLSRASVAQMELGNRQVTSLELDRLAYLYGRDIRGFLAEQFEAKDALTVMFRSNPDLGREGQVSRLNAGCGEKQRSSCSYPPYRAFDTSSMNIDT